MKSPHNLGENMTDRQMSMIPSCDMTIGSNVMIMDNIDI